MKSNTTHPGIVERVWRVAAAIYAVKEVDFMNSRSRCAVLARQQAIAALYGTRMFSRVDIAKRLGMDATSVGIALRRHHRAVADDAHYARIADVIAEEAAKP